MIWQILWTIFALFLVIAIAYATLLLLKKKGIGRNEGKYIKVVDIVHMGQDKQLCIVEIPGRMIMIGITGNSINYICDIDNDMLSKGEINE